MKLKLLIPVLYLHLTACMGGSMEMVPKPAPIPEPEPSEVYTEGEQTCVDNGWIRTLFQSGEQERKVMWKAPPGDWVSGAIVLLHGGGGLASQFCAGEGLPEPQIAFSEMALNNGFAVFSLGSTTESVLDSEGRPCGKRFDFSVLDRENADLSYIEKVLVDIIPNKRPLGSSQKIFMAGLSSGGYMTIRASTKFDNLINAFAPISAGDPYGTDAICDPDLSPRESVAGILVDRETELPITDDGACLSIGYPGESEWETASPEVMPKFKQFNHTKDGVVDFSCAQKANLLLKDKGYREETPFIVYGLGEKALLNHFWLEEYNQPLLDFFLQESLQP